MWKLHRSTPVIYYCMWYRYVHQVYKFTLGQLNHLVGSDVAFCADSRLAFTLAVMGFQDVGLSKQQEVLTSFPQLLFKGDAKSICDHQCFLSPWTLSIHLENTHTYFMVCNSANLWELLKEDFEWYERVGSRGFYRFFIFIRCWS